MDRQAIELLPVDLLPETSDAIDRLAKHTERFWQQAEDSLAPEAVKVLQAAGNVEDGEYAVFFDGFPEIPPVMEAEVELIAGILEELFLSGQD